MRRRSLVVGMPSLICASAIRVNLANAQSNPDSAGETIRTAREKLTEFRRAFLTSAQRQPLEVEYDPIQTDKFIESLDSTIRFELLAATGSREPPQLRQYLLPEFTTYAALTSDFGGLAPTKDEVVPIAFRAPKPSASQIKGIARLLERLWQALQISIDISQALDFLKNHPRLGPLLREIERKISERDYAGAMLALSNFLSELFGASFADFNRFLSTRNPPQPQRPMFRSMASNFVGFVGDGLVTIEVMNEVRADSRSIFFG